MSDVMDSTLVGNVDRRRLLDTSKCFNCDSADDPLGSEPVKELFCSWHQLPV